MKQTMYAVAATEGFLHEFSALFENEVHAEQYAEMLNDDPERGCEHCVVPVLIDESALEEKP